MSDDGEVVTEQIEQDESSEPAIEQEDDALTEGGDGNDLDRNELVAQLADEDEVGVVQEDTPDQKSESVEETEPDGGAEGTAGGEAQKDGGEAAQEELVSLTVGQVEELLARAEGRAAADAGEPAGMPDAVKDAASTIQAAPQQQPSQVRVPSIDELTVSDEEFETILTNREAFAEHQQKVCASMVQTTLQSIVPIVHAMTVNATQNVEIARKFLEDVPELQDNMGVIFKAVGQARVQNPAGTPEQIVSAAKQLLKTSIDVRKNIAASKKLDVRPAPKQRGRFAGANARDSRVAHSSAKPQIDPTDEALAKVAEFRAGVY